ncbi:hypothetical protein E2C01_012778 [Portunus trituberculatus]|uniref:Uncharacterized protein n=1 Tax=Portunus trituberculatus TaxID=210409 RepID=A0A5B7DF59_PORTR|nr:hypothetical protein [Portunus trituberculatus]
MHQETIWELHRIGRFSLRSLLRRLVLRQELLAGREAAHGGSLRDTWISNDQSSSSVASSPAINAAHQQERHCNPRNVRTKRIQLAQALQKLADTGVLRGEV